MAKTLRAIGAQLGGHSSVKLVRTRQTNNLKNATEHEYAHITEMFVGISIQGITGLYHPEYLNSMADSLIPDGHAPTTRTRFDYTYAWPSGFVRALGSYFNLSANALTIGEMQFVEQIGVVKMKRQTIITDDELKDTEGFDGGKKCEPLSEQPLLGLIRVYLFPNVALATAYSKLKDIGPHMLLSEFDQYRGAGN